MYTPCVWNTSYTDHDDHQGCHFYTLIPPYPHPTLPIHTYCLPRPHKIPSGAANCFPMATYPCSVTGVCFGVPLFKSLAFHYPAQSNVSMGNRSSCLLQMPLQDDISGQECKMSAQLGQPQPLRPLRSLQHTNPPQVLTKKALLVRSKNPPQSSQIVTRQQGGRSVVCGRPRRVTKRVEGVRTPQPYQKRRRSETIQDEVLLLPGDHLSSSSSCPTGYHPYFNVDYEEEVMRYLLEVEARYVMRHSYVGSHPSVNQRTRAILVDWLIQVQSYLEVSQETLYQSVALVDRVLEVRCVPVPRVQLLAITALLIVSKLEEKEPIETSRLLQLTLDLYTHAELLSLERQVLVVVNFQVTYADPSIFLNYFLYLTCNSQDQMVAWCCGFLVESVLVEPWPLETRPSLLAAGALYGALRVLRGARAVVPLFLFMPEYFSLNEVVVISTSLRMLEALANRSHSPFQGAVNKYSSKCRYQALTENPSLSPENLFIIADQVRTRLVELRGEETIIVKKKKLINITNASKYTTLEVIESFDNKIQFGDEEMQSLQSDNMESPVAMDSTIVYFHEHTGCSTGQLPDNADDTEDEMMEVGEESDTQVCVCAL
nr:G2/mitotic-specific cyclin-B3-like isoform X2 [Cherax quadricarinatus]